MARGIRVGGRAGYAAAAAVCAVLLWVINVAPGWQAWGFLTAQTADVLGVANLALLVGLASNAAAMVWGTPLLRGLRDALASTFALILLARLFVAFPFDIDSPGWRIAMRVLLGVLMAVSFVVLVTGWGRVARALHVNVHLRR